MPKKLTHCSYDTYYSRLRSSKHSISCCNKSFKPTQYTKHLVSFHSFDKSSHCPWCRCEFDRLGGLKANVDHLSKCFRIIINKTPAPSTVTPPATVCEECLGFDSDRERFRYYHHSEDPTEKQFLIDNIGSVRNTSWFEDVMADAPDPFPFDRASGLAPDVPMAIELYRRLPQTDYIWKHIFLKKSSFASMETFLRSTQVGLLPFGCMCESGPERHAHLLAVGPVSDFNRHWRKVSHAKEKKNGPKSKGSKTVSSLFYLINVIFYVGKRRSSQCQWGVEDGRDNHYLLFRPLGEHALMYAFMLVPGGYQRWAKIKLGFCQLDGLEGLLRTDRIPIGEMKDKSKHVFFGCYVPLAMGYRESTAEEGCSNVMYDPEDRCIRFVRDDGFTMVKSELFSYYVSNNLGFNERFLDLDYEFAHNQKKMAKCLIRDRDLQYGRVHEKFSKEREKLENQLTLERDENSKLRDEIVELRTEIVSLKDPPPKRRKTVG